MRIVTWTIRLVLFLLLVALAAKNIEPVTLSFYFGVSRQAPLIVILFGAFGIGALFGMLALLGTLLRQRREISILRKSQKVPAEVPPEVPPPEVPPPDVLPAPPGPVLLRRPPVPERELLPRRRMQLVDGKVGREAREDGALHTALRADGLEAA